MYLPALIIGWTLTECLHSHKLFSDVDLFIVFLKVLPHQLQKLKPSPNEPLKIVLAHDFSRTWNPPLYSKTLPAHTHSDIEVILTQAFS